MNDESLQADSAAEGRTRLSARVRYVVPALLGAACLLAPLPSHAQTLTENVQLQFGTVLKPTAGSVTWTIDLNDVGSGTASFVKGPTLTGDYLVKRGGGPALISIDVAPNASIPGITIGSFTASYDGTVISLPATNQPDPGGPGKVLRIGATLTIDSSVATGSHLPGITITIIKL
jgi:hypothetical protein